MIGVQWLAGDVTNLLGAAWQGLLPTMIILAVYYSLCDIILIGQGTFIYYPLVWVPTDLLSSNSILLPSKATPLPGTFRPRHDSRPNRI